MNSRSTYEDRRPRQRAEPFEVAIEEHITREDLMVLSYSGDDARKIYAERIRSRMARSLANYIIAHCELMDDEDILRAKDVVRFQCTINDMGAYTSWLPHERKEGRVEGFMAGLNDAVEKIYTNQFGRQF